MSQKTLPPPTQNLITGAELKMFYNNLSKMSCDAFREAIMERCDWTYPVWRSRLHSLTRITKLESEAISIIMASFKPHNHA